jgi:hypothetical protein
MRSVSKRTYIKSPVNSFDFCRSVAYCGNHIEKQRLCKSINDRFLIKIVIKCRKTEENHKQNNSNKFYI